MQNPDVRILQLPVDPTRPRLCVGVQKLRFLNLTFQTSLESRPLKLRSHKLAHAFLPSDTRLSHRLLDVGRPVRPQQPVDFGGAYGPNGLINRLQIFTGASSTSTLSIPKWTRSGSSSFGYTVRLRVRKHSRRRPVRDSSSPSWTAQPAAARSSASTASWGSPCATSARARPWNYSSASTPRPSWTRS